MDFNLIHKITKLYQAKARKSDNLTYRDYFSMAMHDLKHNRVETIKYLEKNQEPTEKPAFNLKKFLPTLKQKFNYKSDYTLNL